MKFSDLKECPFCGGVAGFIGESASIKCKQCGGCIYCHKPFNQQV